MGGAIASPDVSGAGLSLEVGEVKAGRGIKFKVLLYNSGPRATFVRVTCCKLETQQQQQLQQLPDNHAHLAPSRAVIGPHSTQEVQLFYRPTPADEEKCRVSSDGGGGKTPLALLRLESGDELMRQRLVWADAEGGARITDPTCSNFLADFAFSQPRKTATSGKERE